MRLRANMRSVWLVVDSRSSSPPCVQVCACVMCLLVSEHACVRACVRACTDVHRYIRMRARGTDKMLCKAHHATGRDRGFRLDRIPLLIETYRLAGFFRRARIVRNLWVRQRPWVVHRHSHGHLKNESDCNRPHRKMLRNWPILSLSRARHSGSSSCPTLQITYSRSAQFVGLHKARTENASPARQLWAN